MLNKDKARWKEYFLLENSILDYINSNTICLTNDTTNQEIKYIRKIMYTSDKNIIKNLEKKIKNLKSKYIEILGKDTNRMSRNFPIIIKNVENINMNMNSAYQSLQIDRTTKKNMNKIFHLTDIFFDDIETMKKINKVKEKYNLIIENTEINENGQEEAINIWKISIKGEDLLDISNSNKLQLHYFTGTQFILNIRKKGENRSKRYKYGVVILDSKPTISNSNKEARRSHTLDNTCDKFYFEFEIYPVIYIKEKKSNQLHMF